MAIITEDSPIGFELRAVSRQLSVDLNKVKTDDGEIPTLHTDPEAAAKEGLDKPIAIGSRIFGVIPRMMMDCFGEGWIVGGKGSIVTRRSVAVDALITAKGIVKEKRPEGDDHIRVVCDVWVEADDGEKIHRRHLQRIGAQNPLANS